MATKTATTVVRADVVGSLLRPEYLRETRDAARAGTMSPDEVRAAEDRAVLEAIALQESAGIEAITDGEYRRNGWIALIPIFDDPIFRPPVSGFEFLNAESGWRDLWKTGAGDPGRYVGAAPEEPFVTRRLEVDRDIVTDEYAFLKANARARTKYTIPAPSWHRIYWHPEYSKDAYPTSDEFIEDVARILREHVVDRLVELGCDYIQIDAPELRAVAHRPGQPRGVRGARARHGARARRRRRVRQHGLRGPHRRDARDAHVPRERAGRDVGRERRLRGDLEGGLPAPEEPRPAAARVRLGPRRRLRSARRRAPAPPGRARARDDEGRRRSRTPDELVARIEEATQYVPLERLAVSPQCGFASGEIARTMSLDEQDAKLRLVGDVARRVWA